MDNIKDIITKVIGNMAEHKGDEASEIIRLWPTLVNEKAAKHSKIVGMKNGTLLVNVDSSAWLYQININRTTILKKIKEKFAGVQNIRFKIGKVS